ncbi:MAG: hypothetical protein BZY88_13495 [SAR202 cluster bacterium Io17-Chloro-G9]|nr:MAG: hypothetical protein BZY88_13495 [SAR202 cluster bacterium Io17-Chloro-G9]
MTTVEMKGMVDLVNLESDRLADFLTGLNDQAWSLNSACEGWTVGDVVGHLTSGAESWAANATRAVAGDADPPPGQQFLATGERGSHLISQTAISARQQMGPNLLSGYTTAHARLRQVLSSLGPEDWDKPCYHRRGPMPLKDYISLRVQELSVHGWDIRSGLDKSAELGEESLPVLVSKVPRWLRTAFLPGQGLPTPTRFRFDISGPVPIKEDLLVTGDDYQVEPSGGNQADVTFQCNTGNYILLIFGRLNLEEALTGGRLAIGGAKDRASEFTTWFQGF